MLHLSKLGKEHIVKIHILDIEIVPDVESSVTVNCGVELSLFKPVATQWDNGLVCEKCLELHRSSTYSKRERTFALLEE